MAIEHAVSGEVIDLNTFGPEDNDTHSVAIVKTDRFEAIRMCVYAGSTVPPHDVEGPITVQCLRGEGTFFVEDDPKAISAGSWLYLEGGKTHSIEAKTDLVLLVTLVFAV